MTDVQGDLNLSLMGLCLLCPEPLKPDVYKEIEMQITEEWLEGIKDEEGLTRGQLKLLEIWEKRWNFACYGFLPNQVAHFIEGCKSYRGEGLERIKQLQGWRR